MFPQSRACEARVQTVIKIHKRNENFKNGRVLCRFTAARSTLKPHTLYVYFLMFSISNRKIYRECQGFRLTLQDNYFRVTLARV